MAVPAHEPHGEEIQEASEVALDAVARSPVRPRTVMHGELGDPVAPIVCQHGKEAVELAVDAEVADDVGAVGLEPAIEVVEPQARDATDDSVEDPRRKSLCQRVAPFGLPARDEVVALVELGE